MPPSYTLFAGAGNRYGKSANRRPKVHDTSKIISAFSEEHVVKLTGLSVHQLRHWDRTGFFKPEFASENRREAFSRVYSFKDIASLRVLSILRNQFNVSLQHLRQVSHKLSHLADDKWTRTTLYVLNRKVNFYDPETDQLQEVVSGQYALGIALEVVMSDTRRDIANLQARTEDQFGKIERKKRFVNNAWFVAGTRIPIKAIRGFHEAGYSIKKIMSEYPDLTEADIRAAIEHSGNGKSKAA